MITIKSVHTSEDMETCFRIREDVFIVEQKVPAEIERDAYDEKALHVLALSDGAAIGTARVVIKDNGKTAKIGRVAVRKAYRGSGIGKRMIEAIEKMPELRQVDRFVLEAQTQALPFYERLGYQAHGDVFMDAGIPHRHMKKNKSHARVIGLS